MDDSISKPIIDDSISKPDGDVHHKSENVTENVLGNESVEADKQKKEGIII